MKRYGKILSVLAAAAMLMSFAACGQSGENSSNSEQSNAPQSSTPESTIESEAPQSSPAESAAQSEMPQSSPAESAAQSEMPQSSPAESSTESEVPQSSPAESVTESGTESSEQPSITEISSYGLESYKHPDYLIGKWSLVVETSELSGEQLENAIQRMKDTSIVLNRDGTAVGIYQTSRIKGYWGEQGGYVYVALGGDEPQAFGYYVDTLVSLTYQGMSFVK